ncbi:hypothetical protein ACOTWZ_23940 [Burkholderia glumae]
MSKVELVPARTARINVLAAQQRCLGQIIAGRLGFCSPRCIAHAAEQHGRVPEGEALVTIH